MMRETITFDPDLSNKTQENNQTNHNIKKKKLERKKDAKQQNMIR